MMGTAKELIKKLVELPDEKKYEEWKDVKGYEGLYQVSNLGRVKSLPKKTNNQYSNKKIVLKPIKHKNGYYFVNIGGKVKSVHRLVAETFIPNPYNKKTVNHIDGNKNNNNVDNLEWNTHGENLRHAYNNKLKKATSNHLKRKINQYDKNGKYIKTWECAKEVERILGINHSNIGQCCKQRKSFNTAGGYIWRYKE